MQLLSSRNWELEAAVHDALNEKEGIPSVFVPPPPQPGLRYRPTSTSSGSGSPSPRPSPSPPAPVVRGRGGLAVAQQHQTWWEWLVNLAIFPLRFVLNAASDLLQFLSK